jgi:hypothetical protein
MHLLVELQRTARVQRDLITQNRQSLHQPVHHLGLVPPVMVIAA